MGSLRSRQHGLSWLDVGIVVFLLGIVAAIVIPRFMTLHSDAHLANVEGTAQALSAGVLKLSSQYEDSDKPTALPVTLKKGVTHFVIFSAAGHPQGFGKGKSNYVLFDNDEDSEKACRDFFKVAMSGVPASVITKADYINGDNADYIALGYRTRVYGGCRYMYTKGQPTNEQIYAIYYDGNNGEVRVDTEDKPK